MVRVVGAASPVDRGLLLDRGSAPVDTDAPTLRAETDIASVGVHDVATTDTPAVPWTGQVPDWFENVVPGATAALRRPDIVCSGEADLAAALGDRLDATAVTVEHPTESTVRTALLSHLGTVDIDVSFPSTDEAHATVSRSGGSCDVAVLRVRPFWSHRPVGPPTGIPLSGVGQTGCLVADIAE